MKFRYTLSELLVAVTLIGVGCGGLVIAFNPEQFGIADWYLLLLVLSTTAIGWGVAIPFDLRAVGKGIGLIVGIIIAEADSSGIIWDGFTNLEIQFIITQARTSEPIPNATIEIVVVDDVSRPPPRFELATDASGIARKQCPDSWMSGTISGLKIINTYHVQLPYWRFRVVAPGFRSSEWDEIHKLERRAHRVEAGHALLVVNVACACE